MRREAEAPPGPRLLVVEDSEALRRGIVRALEGRFAWVDALGDGALAVERLQDPGVQSYDVLVSDLRLPGCDGLEVLRAARERDARTAVLLMTAYGSIDGAVAAMRAGAFDFLQKPFDLAALEGRVDEALEHASGRATPAAPRRDGRAEPRILVGTSSALREAVALARRAAPTRSTVLITGETGTGKELLAGLVHEASPRARRPFVKVNCAALPETLLESELFGHERGAFTSADRRRIGRFEQADGGTLFLDEVGDMSPATQAKLLRVLQEQEFQRLGGTQMLRTDVRILAATNCDLSDAMRRGRFREDLYFRLAVIQVRMPPLRERPEDVERLATHFLETLARELGCVRPELTPAARQRLRQHSWPGNGRELRNVLERALLLGAGPRLDAADLSLGGDASPTLALSGRAGWRPGLPPEGLSLEAIERAVVLEALARTGWVQKEAAAWLGVSRRKLHYMIGRMGITHPSWPRNREQGPDAGEARSGAGGDGLR